MNRVVHFEIHADDPERAQVFYKTLFGWRFDRFGEQDYWLVFTGPAHQQGINGGLHKRVGGQANSSVSGFVCTVDVNDLDEMTAKVVKHGGQCMVRKQVIPQIGWFAYCKDTEGNIFGLIQHDKKAK